MVVFGEYVQALAAYLRRLVPRTSGHLRAQVETDIWKLGTTFREHRVSHRPLGWAWGVGASDLPFQVSSLTLLPAGPSFGRSTGVHPPAQ